MSELPKVTSIIVKDGFYRGLYEPGLLSGVFHPYVPMTITGIVKDVYPLVEWGTYPSLGQVYDEQPHFREFPVLELDEFIPGADYVLI